MLPGPVFEAEVRATARRWRSYASRSCYGAALLAVLVYNYYVWLSVSEGSLSFGQMAKLAQTTFYSVAGLQLLAVMIATPSLAAGAIAEERQRKTLDYLLASRLRSREIVVGKLTARLLAMSVLLIASVPILALLSLLGGIDPKLNLLLLAVTVSTMLLVGALSIFLSSVSRRPRDAIRATHGLVGLWFLYPLLLRLGLLSRLPSFMFQMLSWIGDWTTTTSPFGLVNLGFQVYSTGADVLIDPAIRMMMWQAPMTLVLIVLAAWRLRPYSQRVDGTQRSWWRRSVERTARNRPGCGDWPMLWKELRTERRGGWARFLERIAGLSVAGLVIWGGAWVLFVSSPFGWSNPGQRFNEYLFIITPLLSVVLISQVMTVAAGSITGERESDTWTGLTATTLTGREILAAKLLGALWRGRGLLALILLIWITGCFVGALQWRVMAIALIELGVYMMFAGCFGLVLSLAMPNTHRAQVLGFGLLIFVNVFGQAALGVWYSMKRTLVPFFFPGCMPVSLGETLRLGGSIHWLMSWLDVKLRMASESNNSISYNNASDQGWHIATVLLGMVVYAALAYGLWRLALVRYEIAAGRPRRSQKAVHEPKPAASLDPIAKPA
jgi:ABC-type transport system involved in multi-copper enzyme maturation permease subunit